MNLDRFGRWIECLFERHKFVRRFVVLTFAGLGLIVTARLFLYGNLDFDGPVAAAYASFTTCIAAVLSFYTASRGRDDK